METLIAALIGAGAALTGMIVTQYFAERRLQKQLDQDRDMRIRDDRKLLLREFVAVAYDIQNKLKRAGNFLLVDEIAGGQPTDEALNEIHRAVGDLTGEANNLLPKLQGRIREIEILCGKDVSLAAYPVNDALGRMFECCDPRNNLDKSELDRLDKDAELRIKNFCESISAQVLGQGEPNDK